MDIYNKKYPKFGACKVVTIFHIQHSITIIIITQMIIFI